MMAKTHQTFAVTCVITATFFGYLQSNCFFMVIVCAMIGALLPDLDSEKSSAGRYLPIGSWLFRNILGHRTVTHSLFALLIISCGFLFLPQQSIYMQLLTGLLIGYTSHILGDMIVGGGVGLLWPLPGKFTLNPIGIAVGGIGEYIIFLTLLLTSIYMAYLIPFNLYF